MPSHIDAVNQAVYSALTSDVTLMGMISGAYSYTPQDATFPYVTIGDSALGDLSTMGADGQQIDYTIHVWSQYRGTAEAAQIIDRVYAVLHRQPLTIAGVDHAGTMFSHSTILRDPDGLTWHGIARFAITVTE